MAFGHFFGLSHFHGHGSWLMCEVAIEVEALTTDHLRASTPDLEKQKADFLHYFNLFPKKIRN